MNRDLRRRAEDVITANSVTAPYLPTDDVKSLIQELHVYEIELEMQNEELRHTQMDLIRARDASAELYEFAPVGYLTLDAAGIIVEANFAGAAMLGLERGRLAGRRFSSFVAAEGAEAWARFHQLVSAGNVTDKIEIAMRDANGTPFAARLECRHEQREVPEDCRCLLVLVDISERARVERALQESEQRLAAELAAMTRLHELVTSLYVCTSLTGAMEEVLAAAIQITGADCGFIRLLNQQTGALEIVARHGYTPDDPYQRELAGRDGSTCGRAITTGERAIVDDVRDDTWYGPRGERAAAVSSFAVQSTPLTGLQGTVLGTLCTQYDRPGRPPDRDLRVLDLLARQAAEHVERRRATEAVERLNRTLEHRVADRTAALVMLCDIASVANGAESVEAAAVYILKRVSEHNGWLCGHCWLPAGASMVLRARFTYYEEAPPRTLPLRQAVEGAELQPGQGMVGRVFLTGDPEYSTDVEEFLNAYAAPAPEMRGVTSVFAFPIRMGGEISGVLEFFSGEQLENGKEQRESVASVGILLGHVIERQRAEQALRDREARMRGILNTAADAIVAFDQTGTIELFNPAAEHIFGYTAAQARGQNIKLLMPFPYADGHDSYVARYLEKDAGQFTGFDRDILVRHRDGNSFPVRLSVSELRGETGNLFIGVMHDLSERRALEHAVAEAASAQQRFIGRELHDNLSQLMAGVEMTAAALKVTLERVAPEETPRAEMLLETVLQAQDVVLNLIQGLRPLHVGKHDILDALRELCDSVAVRCALKCRLVAPTKIIAPDDRTATELFYIAQEAVNNATQHADAGEVTVYIARRAGSIVLLVEDDGEGISPAILAAPSTGLKIMDYRAAQIGGHLTIARRPEGGTAVTLLVST